MKINRRSLKNMLLYPELQIHYGMLFLAVTIVSHSVMALIIMESYAAWRANADDIYGVSLVAIVAAVIVLYLLIFLFAFGLGLLITHRIYGPLVAVERGLKRMNDGDYSQEIALRDSDDPKLKELVTQLNRLGSRLKKLDH